MTPVVMTRRFLICGDHAEVVALVCLRCNVCARDHPRHVLDDASQRAPQFHASSSSSSCHPRPTVLTSLARRISCRCAVCSVFPFPRFLRNCAPAGYIRRGYTPMAASVFGRAVRLIAGSLLGRCSGVRSDGSPNISVRAAPCMSAMPRRLT